MSSTFIFIRLLLSLVDTVALYLVCSNSFIPLLNPYWEVDQSPWNMIMLLYVAIAMSIYNSVCIAIVSPVISVWCISKIQNPNSKIQIKSLNQEVGTSLKPIHRFFVYSWVWWAIIDKDSFLTLMCYCHCHHSHHHYHFLLQSLMCYGPSCIAQSSNAHTFVYSSFFDFFTPLSFDRLSVKRVWCRWIGFWKWSSCALLVARFSSPFPFLKFLL